MIWVARIGGLLSVVAMLAGCTTTSSGQPSPTSAGSTTDTNTTGPATSTSASKTRAVRPREIRLNGKDPCALLPNSDWPKFYIDKPGKLDREPTLNAPECFYSNNTGAFVVMLVATEGIDKWTDGSRSATAKQVASVEGFPAISLTLKGDNNRCDVLVDVADGQYISAGVNIVTQRLSQVPERCDYAHQLAESVMKTLVRP